MKQAELEKRFILNYYHYDGSIELVRHCITIIVKSPNILFLHTFDSQKDIKMSTTFLKRMKVDGVEQSELFLGNKLLILNRHIVILQYCDEPTREFCQPKEERCILVQCDLYG